MWPTCNFPITAIDLETTGLAVASARIVQVGIVGADEDGVERDSWFALVGPPAEALPWGLARPPTGGLLASSFSEIADQVLSRLAATTIVAHNAAFDVHVLAQEFARAGRAWRPGRVRCTLALARARLPKRPSYRLADLAWELGLPRATHEALADARCALALYRSLMPAADRRASAGSA